MLSQHCMASLIRNATFYQISATSNSSEWNFYWIYYVQFGHCPPSCIWPELISMRPIMRQIRFSC